MVREAEEFAARDFGYALTQGKRLTPEEYDDVVARLHSITTLDEGFIRRTDLRWAHHEFAAELLRGDGLSVGRIDGRFTARPESLTARVHPWSYRRFEGAPVDMDEGAARASLTTITRPDTGCTSIR